MYFFPFVSFLFIVLFILNCRALVWYYNFIVTCYCLLNCFCLLHRGDPHYVGLMGIDIFDKGGHLVTLSNTDQQIWANPADINVLPEYGMYEIIT